MGRGRRLFLLVAAGGCAVAPLEAEPSFFDRPLEAVVVELPPDPRYPYSDQRLTCFYYGRIMVRRADLEYRHLYSVLPAAAAKPPCRKPGANEAAIRWAGEFVGLKGRFLFFAAGTPRDQEAMFAVFDTQGVRVIQDMKAGAFVSVRLDGDALVLRFRRKYFADCSLYYGAATQCWASVRRETGLADEAASGCREAYEREMRQQKNAGIRGYHAAVAYNTEARYAAGKPTYAALPGAVECSPF